MDGDNVCSGTHATASPDGRFVAFIRHQTLLKSNVTSQQQQQLARLAQSSSNTVTCIKWSQDASHLLFVHNSGLQVFDGDSRGERVRLQNGAGSFDHISLADFIGNHHVLVVWEFGKAKLFDLKTGKSLDVPDLKTTCDGWPWQIRPGNATPPLFALLSRTSTGDQLSLHFSSLNHALPPRKLPTLDAQSLSWSPNGRWLAVLDVPTATPNLYIYTPDGHLFRSYPSIETGEPGFSIKSIAWSPNGQTLALAKHDGKVELLNTRTFSPLALIEHTTTINQYSIPAADKAPIWLEHVSASGERSYSAQSHPMSPPLSKMKADPQPRDYGIAEISFSSDGRYLASRDCRMLNTVWIWDMLTLAAHTVLIQHANVRSLQWHPSCSNILLIDCAEGFAHICNICSNVSPTILPTKMHPKAPIRWLHTRTIAKPIIIITEKTRFSALFPEGCDSTDDGGEASRTAPFQDNSGPLEEEEEDPMEDSLLEILSSRKPLPPKTEPSYTEMIDMEMEEEDTLSAGALEDTFREKSRAVQQAQSVDTDPFDDSQIF